MTVKRQNFDIVSGDHANLVIPIVDEDGNPLSLAGASAKWQLGRGPGVPPIIEKESPGGITIGATSITVRIEPEDTAALRGKFWHEAEITEADDSVSTVMTGTATIRGDLVGG